MEKPYLLRTAPRWLIAEFARPWNVLSWTLVNGGFQRTAGVSWLFLQPNEIASVDSPKDWMMARMREAGLAHTAAFLTSRREHAWVESAAAEPGAACWTVVTLGLSNALRAGDPTGALVHAGTINLLVCCSHGLTAEAALELLALASEAKAAAMLDANVPSRRSGAPATGTGTDCIAIAWPGEGDRAPFAGKHTAIGAAAGRAVYQAVSEGIRDWVEEHGNAK